MIEPTRPDIDCLHTVFFKYFLLNFPPKFKGRFTIGGATIADARAVDYLPENLPLHLRLPQVHICLCLLFWLPTPGQ